MAPNELNFITSNEKKLGEVKDILNGVINIKSKALDLVEIQGTIEDISADKCRRAAEAELPGPYIKWFLQALGHDGLNNLLAAYEDKSAQAVCTFAYSEGPGYEPLIFQGRTNGKIVPARGPKDFGWDPIFEVGAQTYAEMPKEAKNQISHRGKALDKLKLWLESSE
ncbi:MAG: nucleoside triphosphate pyrophosphohydrolase ham1 [Vezdaea acicularis]|nr:MAG: nucleoside triphosphate pyrophosphohydrolase ham1 [Vezdaea acicularis]